MAGEAIRQLTGSETFTCRRVHLKTALTIQQGQEIEVLTQLRRAPITSALDSRWYDFSVHTHSNGAWVKHVFGQVTAGAEKEYPYRSMQTLPRELSRRGWYRKMRAMGLEYGPRFMGLTDMSAHPLERKTVATVINDTGEGESSYSVHPVSMDCLIQALLPATYNGLTRRCRLLGIPTYMEEIHVSPPINREMTIEVVAHEESAVGLSGDVTAISGGKVCIEIAGLQVSTISDSSATAHQDPHAAVELEWQEDLDLIVDGSHLIRPLRDRTAVEKLSTASQQRVW